MLSSPFRRQRSMAFRSFAGLIWLPSQHVSQRVHSTAAMPISHSWMRSTRSPRQSGHTSPQPLQTRQRWYAHG